MTLVKLRNLCCVIQETSRAGNGNVGRLIQQVKNIQI